MIKLFKISILLFFSVQLAAQKKIDILGRILSTTDSLAIANVHVHNMSQSEGGTSALDGSFNLVIKKGDILKFSAIGYKDYFFDSFKCDKDVVELDIYLIPQIYQLDEVSVLPFQKKFFKQDFLKLEVPDTAFVLDLNLPFPKKLKPSGNYYSTNPLMIAVSPIQWAYNVFSREAKMKRKFQQVLQQERYDELIASIYSKEFVQNVTGIEKEEELKSFMTYCKLSDQFVLDANEYDLTAAVLACYDSFQSKRN